MRRLSALVAQVSLRSRLAVLVGLGAAVVLPIGAVLLYIELSGALDDAVTTELRIRADDVAAELEAGQAPISGDGLITQVLDSEGRVVDPAGAAPLVEADEFPSRQEPRVVDRDVDALGGPGRIYLRRVAIDGDLDRVVVVTGSTAPIRNAERRLAIVLGVIGPVLVVGLGTIAWFLTDAALRPVRRMTRQAASISLENPSGRLREPPGRDEIAELGATLNGMLERIEDSIAHERTFVDDASHELRTPIAVLRGELELARIRLADGSATSAETIEALDSALEEADRLARMTDNLLVLARVDAGRARDHLRRVDLLDAAGGALRRVDVDVPVTLSGDEVAVRGDVDLLERLVINLVANGARFAASAVEVEVIAGDRALLRVSDDGSGFPPALLDHALHRFSRHTTSKPRGDTGAGLGLAIVAGIAQAFGGRVELSNGGQLGGAVVEVDFPRAGRREPRT